MCREFWYHYRVGKLGAIVKHSVQKYYTNVSHLLEGRGKMEQEKTKIFSFRLLFLFLFVSIGSEAWGGNTVRVFLMAGQSNMEGNNTPIPRLEELICHANADFTLDGMTCGSTDIEDPVLAKFFLDNDQPLNDYYDAQAVDPNHPVVIELGEFLCTAGKRCPVKAAAH
jgi:hypothetical protein